MIPMAKMRGFVILGHAILVFLSCGEASSELAPMEESEKQALYSSIQGFVGDWWNGSDLYPDPCGWTPIQGVSCDLFGEFWYVTALFIGPVLDNSLECSSNVEFSSHLFKLSHLKSLSFFKCFLSHPIAIPDQDWHNLAMTLESLEFRSNPRLIGQVPSTLFSLVNLESLVMLQNGLSGSLPPSIGNLIKLKKLVLAGNRFVGRIPDSLGLLRELLILDLSRNRLSGDLGMSIGDLGCLLKLDLSSNQLEGKIPEKVGFLRNLSLLDLSKNNFSDGLGRAFQEMYSLEEMVLSDNPMGGELDVVEWEKLQNLVILDLSNMGLNGEIPDSMSGLGRLRFLGLSDNNLKGAISEKLATLPCISAMYLNGNGFSGKLRLSESFYSKMGRRFGVWGNPDLCYQVESVDSSIAPFGVKPCVQEIKVLELDSMTKLSGFEASLGCLGLGFDGFWWVLLVEVLALVL